MNERILQHVEDLFKDAPRTRRVTDIREELLSNMNEKFNDLIAEGKSEDEAFQSVIGGIGDIDGLIDDITKINRESFADIGKAAVKTAALLKSAAIGLYIIAVAAFFFSSAVLDASDLGLVVMLCIAAAATTLLVYSFSFTGKKYKRENDTFVEEYKEKISIPDRESRIMGAASSLLWLMIVIVYMLISFSTQRWDVTWIVFLVGVVLQQVLTTLLTKKINLNGIIMSSAVIVYFVISFMFQNWYISWIIFIIAAALVQVVRFYEIWREK